MNSEPAVDKQLLIAAFKRGVRFRETTNAPVPGDCDIMRKLEDGQKTSQSRS